MLCSTKTSTTQSKTFALLHRHCHLRRRTTQLQEGIAQCCRNEHEQMNTNKQDKQTKHKPTPAALFVRERSPTLVCPLTFRTEIFFLSFKIAKKPKRSQAGKEEI